MFYVCLCVCVFVCVCMGVCVCGCVCICMGVCVCGCVCVWVCVCMRGCVCVCVCVCMCVSKVTPGHKARFARSLQGAVEISCLLTSGSRDPQINNWAEKRLLDKICPFLFHWSPQCSASATKPFDNISSFKITRIIVFCCILMPVYTA